MRCTASLSSLSLFAVLACGTAGAAVLVEPPVTQDQAAEQSKDSTAKDNNAKEAPRYPQAARQEPKQEVSRENSKALVEIGKTYNAKDFAKTRSLVDEFVPKAKTPYEKAMAYELGGTAAFSLKDYAAAATSFQEAIAANGLDNNGHYDSMSNLVASLSNSGKYPEALKVLDQFIAETKTTDPQYSNMRLSLLAHTGKAGDAEAAYKERLAKDPNDRKSFQNLLATYQQQGKRDEMIALMRDRYKAGLLNTWDDLHMYYVALLQDPEKNWKEAQTLLDAEVAKGTIPKNDQTATAYSVIAQTVLGKYMEGLALEDYAKAASMSTNGTADMNRANILYTQGKKAEARAAALEAQKKGVKNPAQLQRYLK